MVSKASDDLPDPLTPVMTTNLLRGTTTSMFLRLCSRAPRMTMESMCGEFNSVRRGGVPALLGVECDAVHQPLPVRLRHPIHLQHNEFRYLVRMPLEQRLAQRFHPLVARFDQQKLLGVVLHCALPAIHGVDLREDIHARRETAVDELVGQRVRIEAAADGSQYNDRLHRCAAPAICCAASRATSRAVLRKPSCRSGRPTKNHDHGPPTPTPVGAMRVLRCFTSNVRTPSSVPPSYILPPAATFDTTKP